MQREVLAYLRARPCQHVSPELVRNPGTRVFTSTITGVTEQDGYSEWVDVEHPWPGFAPLEWIAVQGLRRNSYAKEADRISKQFLTMVLQEFMRYGTLEEKYDVVRRSAPVDRALRYGYHTNEAGLVGRTNAVFNALFDELTPADQQSILGKR